MVFRWWGLKPGEQNIRDFIKDYIKYIIAICFNCKTANKTKKLKLFQKLEKLNNEMPEKITTFAIVLVVESNEGPAALSVEMNNEAYSRSITIKKCDGEAENLSQQMM